MDVFCFGDSITLGEYDTEHGGWVDRLKTECMARYVAGKVPEVCVFNLGIGGETTRGMRNRLANELKVRLATDVQSLVILAYGANDCAEKDGDFMVRPEEYIESLSWAIDESRRSGCEAWLLNITPVGPAAEGVRSRFGKLRFNAVVERYNDLLLDLVRRKSAELVDANNAFLKHELSSLFVADGVHPNTDGHNLIYNLIRERLFQPRA